MPVPKKGSRLGGSPAHQRLMLSNLATALFEHGSITTTETRARLLRPVAEKLITKAKKAHAGDNSLHNRREVLKTIRDKSVVHTLFTEIAPVFVDRPGGYTRITKIGPRKGDNAPMAVIELVTEPYAPKPAAPRRAAPRTTPTPVETTRAAGPVAAPPAGTGPEPDVDADVAPAATTAADPATDAVEETSRAAEPVTAPPAGTGPEPDADADVAPAATTGAADAADTTTDAPESATDAVGDTGTDAGDAVAAEGDSDAAGGRPAS